MLFKVHSPAGAARKKQNNSRTHRKNKHSTRKKIHISLIVLMFWSPTPRDRKNSKILPQNPPQSLRGPPRDSEIEQLVASGGGRGPPNICFAPPRAAPKSHLERSWRPHWAPMAPRSAPAGSKPSFWTLWGLSGERCSSILLIFTCVLHVLLRRFVCVFVFVLVFAPFFLQPSQRKI